MCVSSAEKVDNRSVVLTNAECTVCASLLHVTASLLCSSVALTL